MLSLAAVCARCAATICRLTALIMPFAAFAVFEPSRLQIRRASCSHAESHAFAATQAADLRRRFAAVYVPPHVSRASFQPTGQQLCLSAQYRVCYAPDSRRRHLFAACRSRAELSAAAASFRHRRRDARLPFAAVDVFPRIFGLPMSPHASARRRLISPLLFADEACGDDARRRRCPLRHVHCRPAESATAAVAAAAGCRAMPPRHH